jgi:hypothetical protein
MACCRDSFIYIHTDTHTQEVVGRTNRLLHSDTTQSAQRTKELEGTHRQQGDFISLVLFLQNKESRLKSNVTVRVINVLSNFGLHSKNSSSFNALHECELCGTSRTNEQTFILVYEYRVYFVSTCKIVMCVCEV